MANVANARPPAFKHGAYSALALLPGEDEIGFNKLRKDLVAEFGPQGIYEEDLVDQFTGVLWRKKNLFIYSVVKQAKEQLAAAQSAVCSANEIHDYPPFPSLEFPEPQPRVNPEKVRARPQRVKEAEAALAAVKNRIQNEFGRAEPLLHLGEVVTLEYLVKELELLDRLDSAADRILKRLLHVRGLKSLDGSAQSNGKNSEVQRIAHHR